MSSIKPYSLIYLGTPEFAETPLIELVKNELFDIKAVITQPDKPSGRGHKLKAPPLKILAEKLEIPCFQPQTLKGLKLTSEGLLEGEKESTKEFTKNLNTLGPFDIAIVVAYGKIIPDSFLNYPRLGNINIHPSLLPKHRGAAPIQRALFSGEKTTGTSIMQLDSGLDTGPVFAQQNLEINPGENYQELEARLSKLSSNLLLDILEDILEKKIASKPQNDSLATYAEKWEVETDCWIKWEEPALVSELRVRASALKPGARCRLNGENIKIFKAMSIKRDEFEDSNKKLLQKAPGELAFISKKELIVCCKEDTYLQLEDIQLPGKKVMKAQDLINSSKIDITSKFS